MVSKKVRIRQQSKKLQIQGAQILRNEANFHTLYCQRMERNVPFRSGRLFTKLSTLTSKNYAKIIHNQYLLHNNIDIK